VVSGRPAFIPGCEYDVFISYAHVDNEFGWISHFKDQLEKRLNGRLGRIGAAQVFFDDASLAGNERITPKIRAALAKTAALVVVLSPGYLASTWCCEELTCFLENIGDDAETDSRVFLVLYDDVNIEEKPQPIRELIGYSFFRVERNVPKTLALGDERYDDELNRLRYQLAERLKRLREEVERPRPAADERPTVFLAEAFPGLEEEYGKVENFLLDGDIRVVPGRHFYHAPDGYEQDIDAHLSGAWLFVQLLDRLTYPPTDAFAEGYQQWLAGRARQTGKPVLQWRRRDLDHESVIDASHRTFVFGDEIVACDLPAFMPLITNCLNEVSTQQRLQQARKLPSGEGEKYILLRADPCDGPMAEAVGEDLLKANIGYDLIDDATPLTDATAAVAYDAVMLFFGHSSPSWIRERVLEYRDVLLRQKSAAPPGAIYVGPAPDKPLKARLPQLRVIRSDDETALREFVAAVIHHDHGGQDS